MRSRFRFWTLAALTRPGRHAGPQEGEAALALLGRVWRLAGRCSLLRPSGSWCAATPLAIPAASPPYGASTPGSAKTTPATLDPGANMLAAVPFRTPRATAALLIHTPYPSAGDRNRTQFAQSAAVGHYLDIFSSAIQALSISPQPRFRLNFSRWSSKSRAFPPSLRPLARL